MNISDQLSNKLNGVSGASKNTITEDTASSWDAVNNCTLCLDNVCAAQSGQSIAYLLRFQVQGGYILFGSAQWARALYLVYITNSGLHTVLNSWTY